jgi:predicted transcriptional regulator
LTAREVAARLDHERDLAYTTVLTVLERLERKGFVRRQRAARAHRYAASDSREAVVAEAMMEALGTADDRGSALVRFVGSVSAEEAEILRRALEPAPEPGTAAGEEPASAQLAGSAGAADTATPADSAAATGTAPDDADGCDSITTGSG